MRTVPDRVFTALNLEILRNPADRQATVWVEITDAALQAIPAILDPSQDGHHNTDPPAKTTASHPRRPRCWSMRHRAT